MTSAEQRRSRRKNPESLIQVVNAMTGHGMGRVGNLSVDGMMLIATTPTREDALYQFVFQATVGQTLGMRLLKLRVVDVYGEPPSYPRAGLRTAAYLASAATLFLGFWWIGFDAEKRGLHDWIAGTYVIRG